MTNAHFIEAIAKIDREIEAIRQAQRRDGFRTMNADEWNRMQFLIDAKKTLVEIIEVERRTK